MRTTRHPIWTFLRGLLFVVLVGVVAGSVVWWLEQKKPSPVAAPAPSGEPVPEILRAIDIREHLDGQLDLDTQFDMHTGERVRLRHFFGAGLPVLLTLNYYRCPMLCTLQLTNLVQALKKLSYRLGKDYRMVTISIDHRETTDLARDKRHAYLTSLGYPEGDWSFLVGDEQAIRHIAGQLGFAFRYDKESDQYAHPAAVFFLSPEGKISRYLYGLEYSPTEIKFALHEASGGRTGSTLDKLILSCFHYDATQGRYGVYALGVMRLAGAGTAVLLAIFLGTLWISEQRKKRRGRHVVR